MLVAVLEGHAHHLLSLGESHLLHIFAAERVQLEEGDCRVQILAKRKARQDAQLLALLETDRHASSRPEMFDLLVDSEARGLEKDEVAVSLDPKGSSETVPEKRRGNRVLGQEVRQEWRKIPQFREVPSNVFSILLEERLRTLQLLVVYSTKARRSPPSRRKLYTRAFGSSRFRTGVRLLEAPTPITRSIFPQWKQTFQLVLSTVKTSILLSRKGVRLVFFFFYRPKT